MKEKHLKQVHVAELCALEESQISQYLNNKRFPSYRAIKKLMKGLHCSANDLFREDDE